MYVQLGVIVLAGLVEGFLEIALHPAQVTLEEAVERKHDDVVQVLHLYTRTRNKKLQVVLRQ